MLLRIRLKWYGEWMPSHSTTTTTTTATTTPNATLPHIIPVMRTLNECYIQYIVLLRHFPVLKLTLEVRVKFTLNECYNIIFVSFSSFEIGARSKG